MAPSPQIETTLEARRPWRNLTQALVTGGLYFVAAWSALQLQGVAGVAIFWPAAGIATGLMLAAGPRGHAPVAAGTIVATAAANLAFGRSAFSSVAFGLLNAAEALAVAWLLAHLKQRREGLPRLAETLCFLAAALASTAVAALGASLLKVSGGASEPWHEIWRTWLLSDLVGIVVVAPLIVAAAGLVRAPARHYDWSKDIALLGLLVAAAWHALSIRLDASSWLALAPGTTVLPVLFWLAARGQPVVPALGVVLLGALIALAAGLGIGRYGDVDIALATRVMAAQATLGTVALVTLVVSALFEERRLADARIKADERRLAVTAAAVPGMIFSLRRDRDGRLHFPFASAKSRHLVGIEPSELAVSADPFLARLDPECRAMLERALDQPLDGEEPISLELACPEGPDQVRWLEVSAMPAAGSDDGTVWHGYLQDVTARKALVDELDHRTRNMLTVVQEIAQLTAEGAGQENFTETFDERVMALAASLDLLRATDWQGVDVEALVRAQLGHLAAHIGSRIRLEGPGLVLQPCAAQVLGMAIHELGTNAIKYGALSNGVGTVRLAWEVSEGADGERFRMCWQEHGGPPVAAGAPQGYGRVVTVQIVNFRLGPAEIELVPEGVRWRVDAPAGRVVRNRRLAA